MEDEQDMQSTQGKTLKTWPYSGDDFVDLNVGGCVIEPPKTAVATQNCSGDPKLHGGEMAHEIDA